MCVYVSVCVCERVNEDLEEQHAAVCLSMSVSSVLVTVLEEENEGGAAKAPSHGHAPTRSFTRAYGASRRAPAALARGMHAHSITT